MTGRERMEAAIERRAPDRVPVLPMAHFMTAQYAGMSIREFATDGDRMAESLIRARELFGWDGVSVGCDVAVESSALGAETAYAEDSPPALVSHVLEDPARLGRLRPPDPLADGRLPVLVRATERCVSEIGDTFHVMTHMNDPLNQAGMLRGVQNLMLDLYDRPDFVEDLLAFTFETQRDLGRALVDAGAHCIFLGAALSSPEIMPPRVYREQVLPVQVRLAADLHEYGARYILLHICGDATPILGDMLASGCDILDLDHQVDMGAAKRLIGGRAAIRGNIDPARLISASPEDIYEESLAIIRAAGEGGGLILAAGCDVMTTTPQENLHAMVRASKEAVNPT